MVMRERTGRRYDEPDDDSLGCEQEPVQRAGGEKSGFARSQWLV